MEEVEEVEVDEDRLFPPLLLLVQLLPLRFPPEAQMTVVEVEEAEVEEAEVEEAEVEEARFAPRDAYLPYLGDGCCSNVRQ